MQVKHHIVSSVPLGLAVYLSVKDIVPAVVAAAFAVVIDADHILDYLITQKKLASLEKMHEDYDSNSVIRRFYLVLHSWELLTILGIINIFYPSGYLTAALAGWIYHMAFDQVFNTYLSGEMDVKNAFYFFLYRMKYGFKVRLLRKQFIEKT